MISWACCGFGARLGEEVVGVGPPLLLLAAAALVVIAEDDTAVAWFGDGGWDEEEWVLLSMAFCWCIRGRSTGGHSSAMVPPLFVS